MEYRDIVRRSFRFASIALVIFIGAGTYFFLNYPAQSKTVAKNTTAVATQKSATVKQSVKKITASESDACDKFKTAINAASKTERVAPSIIRAVIKIESGCKANAKGKSGEIGLMQIKPRTAKGLGADPAKLFQPAYNIKTGTKLLSQLNSRFDSWESTVLAYNRGPNEAKKLMENGLRPHEDWPVKKSVRQHKIELGLKR